MDERVEAVYKKVIVTGDFRETECPAEATLLFTDPPYDLGRTYGDEKEETPYHVWVQDILAWTRAPWTLILGPMPTMREWLPLVPEPSHILWWHRTFLLPRRVTFWAPSLTPVLVYRRQDAKWLGPNRQNRDIYDVIDAHSAMGDITRKRALGVPQPKHPALTGASFPSKVIPFLAAEDDLVVDPMAGCGSILIAAQRLNRRVWGCEIVSEYAAAGNAWLDIEMMKQKGGE